MAIYPGAIRKWLTVNKNRSRMGKPVRVNLHVAVSEARSLFGFFNKYGNADSHFYVRRNGKSEQYVDTSLRANADWYGNPDTISIETQGGVRNAQGEPWTKAQLKTIASIYRWAIGTHGIAKKLATDSRPGASSHGLSWHRLGIDGNYPGGILHGRISGGLRYSKSPGKVCPGNAKIKQIPGILAAATGGTPPAPPKREPNHGAHVTAKTTIRTRLARMDIKRPALLSTWVGRYQRRQRYAPGLYADKVWGPHTEAHYDWTAGLQRAMKPWKGERDTAVDGDLYTATVARVREIQRRNMGGAYRGALDGIPGPYFCRTLEIEPHPGA